jgi:hypothetical protein
VDYDLQAVSFHLLALIIHGIKPKIMIAFSKNDNNRICDIDPIGVIAACLANRFAQPLFNFYAKKSYSVYAKCLVEILNWSYEFYNQYYNNETDWKDFENIRNILFYNNDVHGECFLIAWGEKRIRQFFAQNINGTGFVRNHRNDNEKKQFFSSPCFATDADGKK